MSRGKSGIIMGNKVDIIGIGAQKSATTWLYTCLSAHPQIRCSSKEEMNYFDDSLSYSKGIEWYHKHFEFGLWKTAEYSPTYFYDQDVPERIYKYNPHAKLILSLRNPIDRAFSHYRHCLFSGYIPRGSGFWDTLENNPAMTEQGRYATNLKRFLGYFDIRQIQIILYDDIKTAPQMVVEQLFKFLEIDDSIKPAVTHKRVEVHQFVTSPLLHNLVSSAYISMKKVFGNTFAKILKGSNAAALYKKKCIVEFSKTIPLLSDNDRKRLLEIFMKDMQELSDIIGRDLSSWK